MPVILISYVIFFIMLLVLIFGKYKARLITEVVFFVFAVIYLLSLLHHMKSELPYSF